MAILKELAKRKWPEIWSVCLVKEDFGEMIIGYIFSKASLLTYMILLLLIDILSFLPNRIYWVVIINLKMKEKSILGLAPFLIIKSQKH